MLNGILGLAGLIGGIGQKSGGSRTMGRGMGYYDEGHNAALQAYRQKSKFYQDFLASGGYNPEPALNQARSEFDRSNKIGSSNISAQQGGMGYKKGDSVGPQSQRHFSEKNQLEQSKTLLGIKNLYHQQQAQDLGDVSNSGMQYASYLNGLGRDMYGIGQQQQNAGSNSIAGSMAGLTGLFGKNSVLGGKDGNNWAWLFGK